MKKNRSEQSDELMGLVKKVMQDADSISKTDKKRMKKLISDPTLFLEVVQRLDPDYSVPDFPVNNDTRTSEEIIADNYVALAKFTIEKLQLENVHKLKVQESEGCFSVYALTPEPLELCFEQFATSDYPYNKELLLEIEALQADLFMEDNIKKYTPEIISRIENAVL